MKSRLSCGMKYSTEVRTSEKLITVLKIFPAVGIDIHWLAFPNGLLGVIYFWGHFFLKWTVRLNVPDLIVGNLIAD